MAAWHACGKRQSWPYALCKIETLEQIDPKFVTVYYVIEMNPHTKFGKFGENLSVGSLDKMATVLVII